MEENEERLARYEAMEHQKDSDCTVGEDYTCTGCQVYHGDPCPDCQQRAFHTDNCPLLETPDPNTIKADAAATVESKKVDKKTEDYSWYEGDVDKEYIARVVKVW